MIHRLCLKGLRYGHTQSKTLRGCFNAVGEISLKPVTQREEPTLNRRQGLKPPFH